MSNQRARPYLEGKGALFFTMIFFFAGVILGYAYAVAEPDPTLEELQIEFQAMQMCMQTGSRSGCSMDVQDFIRYHEIKAELDAQ